MQGLRGLNAERSIFSLSATEKYNSSRSEWEDPLSSSLMIAMNEGEEVKIIGRREHKYLSHMIEALQLRD